MNTDKKGWYRVFNIPKKSGGVRVIEAPIPQIKTEQRDILDSIMKLYAPSKFAYGGIIGRNITMAASQHVAHKYILKVDLSDYFHNVTGDEVKQALMQRKDINEQAAEFIRFRCTNQDDVLPMGAPTSMFLANVAAEKMYNAIGKVAENLGGVFTGYVDDLIISCDNYDNLLKILGLIKKICQFYKFPINPKKISIMRNKQEVLGLCVVNDLDHTRLPKKKRYIIKAALHNARKSLESGKDIPADQWNRLQGWVAYSKMANDQWAEKFRIEYLSLKSLRDQLKLQHKETSNGKKE